MRTEVNGYAILLVSGLIAVAAFAGGYVVGTSSSSTPACEIETDEETRPDVEVRANRPPQVVLKRAQSDAREAGEPEPPERSAIRKLVLNLPDPEPEVGDGTITGMVHTEAGVGVSGVIISAVPQWTWERKDNPEIQGDVERLVARLEWTLGYDRWTTVNRVETTTAEDGSFQFDRVIDANYDIRASSDEWRIKRRQHAVVTAGSVVNFTAIKRTACHLRLAWPRGHAQKHASVKFISANEHLGVQWRATNNILDVQPGLYRVEVKAGAHSEFTASAKDVMISEGETTELQLTLTHTPVLVVQVTFPKGEYSDASLLWTPLRDSVKGGTSSITKAKLKAYGQRAERPINAKNEYEFEIVNPGCERIALGVVRGRHVHLHSDGQIVEGFEIVSVRPGLQRHTLRVPQLDSSRYVTLVVRGPAGTHIPSATFTTLYKSDGQTRSGGALATHAVDGRQLVMPAFGVSAPPGEGAYTFSVRTKSYGTKHVSVDRIAGQEIEVHFREVATASIVVEGIEALGLTNEVLCVYRDEPAMSGARHTCDSEGRVTIPSIQPGNVKFAVSIQTTGMGPTQSKIHTESVLLKAGRNNVRLRISKLYEVTVRGGDTMTMVLPKDPVKNPGFHRMVRAAEGVAVFSWMPPGDYTARSGHQSVDFSLPGDTDVELRDLQHK